MSKIVGIRGAAIPEPGKPLADVVERLEWLLGIAKDGQIKGVSAVFTWHDDATGTIRAGWQSYSVVGNLADIQRKILEDLAQ